MMEGAGAAAGLGDPVRPEEQRRGGGGGHRLHRQGGHPGVGEGFAEQLARGDGGDQAAVARIVHPVDLHQPGEDSTQVFRPLPLAQDGLPLVIGADTPLQAGEKRRHLRRVDAGKQRTGG